MRKTSDYKPIAEREWREQSMPIHPLLIDIEQRITAYLERTIPSLMTFKIGLSAVVEFSINYAYQQWIEQQRDYSDVTHDIGMLVYSTATLGNALKESTYIYLKEDTVQRINALGDFLEVTAFYTPRLRSSRWDTYNRKVIIILAMNALNEQLKAEGSATAQRQTITFDKSDNAESVQESDALGWLSGPFEREPMTKN